MPGFVYTTLHSNTYVDVQNIYSHIQWITKRTSAKYKHIIYNIFNHAKEKQTHRPGSETAEVTDFCLLPSGALSGAWNLWLPGGEWGILALLKLLFCAWIFFQGWYSWLCSGALWVAFPLWGQVSSLQIVPVFTQITLPRCPSSSSDSYSKLV